MSRISKALARMPHNDAGYLSLTHAQQEFLDATPDLPVEDAASEASGWRWLGVLAALIAGAMAWLGIVEFFLWWRGL